MQIWLVPGFQKRTGQIPKTSCLGEKVFFMGEKLVSFGKSCCTRFRGGMQKNWGLWSRCWTLEWLPLCNRRQWKPTWGGCVMLTKIPWKFSQGRNWRLLGKKNVRWIAHFCQMWHEPFNQETCGTSRNITGLYLQFTNLESKSYWSFLVVKLFEKLKCSFELWCWTTSFVT